MTSRFTWTSLAPWTSTAEGSFVQSTRLQPSASDKKSDSLSTECVSDDDNAGNADLLYFRSQPTSCRIVSLDETDDALIQNLSRSHTEEVEVDVPLDVEGAEDQHQPLENSLVPSPRQQLQSQKESKVQTRSPNERNKLPAEKSGTSRSSRPRVEAQKASSRESSVRGKPSTEGVRSSSRQRSPSTTATTSFEADLNRSMQDLMDRSRIPAKKLESSQNVSFEAPSSNSSQRAHFYSLQSADSATQIISFEASDSPAPVDRVSRTGSKLSLASTAAGITPPSTQSDEFDSLKQAQSNSIASLFRSIGGPKSNAFDSSSNAVIIYDWDDTLCPTTWSESKEGRISTNAALAAERLANLRQLSAAVEQVLRASRAAARVAIVTLAEPSWFRESAELYFPDLDILGLLKQLSIKVHFAEKPSAETTTLEESEQLRIAAKKKVMAKILSGFYPFFSAKTVKWNVMSVGDSTCEQQALKQLLKENASASPLCKTVKFTADPSLAQLISQLQLLAPCIQDLVSHRTDFDRSSSLLRVGR